MTSQRAENSTAQVRPNLGKTPIAKYACVHLDIDKAMFQIHFETNSLRLPQALRMDLEIWNEKCCDKSCMLFV